MALTKAKGHIIADDLALGGNPTTSTQSASDNSTKIATTAYVTTAVSNLVDGAPSALNTLNEIAAALNDDAALNTTLTNSIATKLPLAGGTLTGNLTLGSSTAGNLAVGSANSFQIQKSGVNAYINQSDSGPIIVRMGSGFTERMRITSSGDILGKTADVRIGSDVGAIEYGTSTNNSTRFYTNNIERMRIQGGGNIGIGTNSPLGKLHVRDGSAQAGISHTYIYDGSAISMEATEPAIQLMAEDSGTHGGSLLWRYGNNAFAAIANPTTDAIDFTYGVTTANDFQVHSGTNMSSYKKILSLGADGKVGIGTDSPDYQLHIAGGGDFLVEDTGNGSAHIRLRSSSGGTASSNWKIKTSSSNYLYVENDTAGTTDIAISNTGKVGIGASTPAHKLQVLSTDNKGFYLERNTGNEPANINEFSSYYSLSIKNRAGGSFLNFGGNAALSSMQATDGAGSATAKDIVLNPYGGHVGIGTTPTAWSSGYKSLQIGNRGFVGAHSGSDLYVGQNAYFSSGWKYEAAVAASLTQHSGGQITHFVAPAGSANAAISWITALHIKTDGKVGIGTNAPTSILNIEGNTNAYVTAPMLIMSSTSTADARVRDWAIGPADSAYGDFHILQGASTGANPLATANSKMHIDAVGNVAIGNAGQAIPAAANLYIKDASDSRVTIYESGASPYTSTLELASQAIGTYGALVQYTSGAEQLTIENYGRALSPGSTSGGIRFRTKVGNGSLSEVMKINGHEGTISQPHQTFFMTNRAAGNQTFANGAWVDIDWTGEPYDTGGNYVLSSGVFTAPIAGVYLFTGLIGLDTIAATNYVLARIVCSSAGDFYTTHQQKRSGGGDYGYDHAISQMIYLAASETVKMQVFAGSGGNHTLGSRSNWQGRLLG